jgi:hypothetical protein
MRKPSAALVVASVALIMATIGTSVAASGYTITSSKQIKPGSISLKALSKQARKELRGARGPQGVPGEDGADGQDGADGDDGADATSLFAQIQANGTVNSSGPGVTARSGGTGIYFVNFGQDITECATVATQASIPNFAGAGLSTTGIEGAAFVSQSNTGVDLAPGYPSQTSVRVQTNRANGTPASTSFAIAVFC